MPVASFSLASNCASHSLPSVLARRSSSASLEKPSLIIPASRMVIGGSSTIAEEISEYISARSSKFAKHSAKRSLSIVPISFFMCGSISSELRNAIKSRGFADLQLIFVIIRSKSYTGFKYSRISSRSIARLLHSSIPACRFKMSSLLISGCSIMERNARAPMAVLVLSSTHKSEPFFCFSRMVSTSSRFRLEELSISIYFPVVYGTIEVMWSTLPFCISYRYNSNAPAAIVPEV